MVKRGPPSIAGFNPVLPRLSHPHPKPSAYEASSQPVFLAAKSGRRKIVRGGKDRMLAHRPQAVFISVRGPPRPGSSTKCQVSYDWSWPQEAPGAKTSLVQKRVEIGSVSIARIW